MVILNNENKSFKINFKCMVNYNVYFNIINYRNYKIALDH